MPVASITTAIDLTLEPVCSRKKAITSSSVAPVDIIPLTVPTSGFRPAAFSISASLPAYPRRSSVRLAGKIPYYYQSLNTRTRELLVMLCCCIHDGDGVQRFPFAVSRDRGPRSSSKGLETGSFPSCRAGSSLPRSDARGRETGKTDPLSRQGSTAQFAAPFFCRQYRFAHERGKTVFIPHEHAQRRGRRAAG